MADDNGITRRQLLKHTGATLGAMAVGACSGDSEQASTGGDSPDSGSAPGGASGTASGGSGAGTGGESAAGGGPVASGGATVTAGGSPGSGGAASGSGGRAAGGASEDGGSAMGSGGAGGSSPGGTDTLAVVHRENLDEAVARAVELAGGIDEIQPGQTVFIKPNAVSDRALSSTGIRTSNDVLAAVIRLVKTRDPGRIIVGDRSARTFDTNQVFERAQITEVALAAGADEVYPAPSEAAEPDAWLLQQPNGYETSWQAAGGILGLRKILEADHLINVPTCKNHRYALFTLSMKNFIGAVADSSRDPIHYLQSVGNDFGPIGRDIAILNQLFNPLINIIDATTAIINGGPQGDGTDTVRTSPGLILAGRDRVALDALGVSLIQLELGRNTVPQPDASHTSLTTMRPWELPQIVSGDEYGVGSGTPDAVKLAFEDVADAVELEAIFRG